MIRWSLRLFSLAPTSSWASEAEQGDQPWGLLTLSLVWAASEVAASCQSGGPGWCHLQGSCRGRGWHRGRCSVSGWSWGENWHYWPPPVNIKYQHLALLSSLVSCLSSLVYLENKQNKSLTSSSFLSATRRESDSQLAMLSLLPGLAGTRAEPKGSKYAERFSSGSLIVWSEPAVKRLVIGLLLFTFPLWTAGWVSKQTLLGGGRL